MVNKQKVVLDVMSLRGRVRGNIEVTQHVVLEAWRGEIRYWEKLFAS